VPTPIRLKSPVGRDGCTASTKIWPLFELVLLIARVPFVPEEIPTFPVICAPPGTVNPPVELITKVGSPLSPIDALLELDPAPPLLLNAKVKLSFAPKSIPTMDSVPSPVGTLGASISRITALPAASLAMTEEVTPEIEIAPLPAIVPPAVKAPGTFIFPNVPMVT
jgi:hypothetical protein